MNVTPLFKSAPRTTEEAEECVKKLMRLAAHLAFLTEDAKPGSAIAEAVVDDLELAVEDLASVLEKLQ